MRTYYVYMMSNARNTVLYVGVTNDLIRRISEHKASKIPGFTKKYNCNKLVWYSDTDDVAEAIRMEKRIKKWKRAYKENLIREINPEWRDLSEDFL